MQALHNHLFQIIGVGCIICIAASWLRNYRGDESLKKLFKRHWIALSVQAGWLGSFIYGVLFFPDPPYHPCGNQWCGKTGIPHSLEVFEAHSTWQLAFFLLFALSFVAGIFIYLDED